MKNTSKEEYGPHPWLPIEVYYGKPGEKLPYLWEPAKKYMKENGID
jgi:hypothetical protein